MIVARRAEVENAADVFGATVEILATENTANTPALAKLEQAFAAAIAQHPTVIVTHALTGGYGHPMHMWVAKHVLRLWRALPPDEQPILAQALDLDRDSVDQLPVTDTISGDELRNGVRLWTRVRDALRRFVTQVACENVLNDAHSRERSSFRLLHPGE